MTLCIGALCEEREAIILAADKMLGQGFIQAELEITKIISIHPDWWIMFAGMVPHVHDIVDEARRQLDQAAHHDVATVIALLEGCYRSKRLEVSAGTYLAPRGWTLSQFQADGLVKLGQFQFQTLDAAIAGHSLNLQLVVAGFDSQGLGHILTLDDPGITSRQDMPGYCAIGTGMFGAMYFMYFRAMSVSMSAAEALYYVHEANIFGYQAGGVGEETDFLIARFQEQPIRFQESQVPVLSDLWQKFGPQGAGGLQRALGRYVRRQRPTARTAQGPRPRHERNRGDGSERQEPAPGAQ